MCSNCFCSFQVRKLEAVGYKPILFIGKQNKKASNKWVADIITHLHPTPVTINFLEKMRRAYEFILTKGKSKICVRNNNYYLKYIYFSLLI